MRKLYAFLMMMLAFGVISVGIANAYTINNFVVRMETTPDAQGLGSGPNWQSITGTNISGLGYYYQMSSQFQVPFNFTFLNQQITTSNSFQVNSYGSVIFSPTWGGFPYDYDAEWFYLSEYGYVYENYAFDLIYNEYGYYTYYGYYPNYKLAPFEGFLTYGPSPNACYAVLGSAPNRELVVQALGVYAYQYGSSSGLNGDWQTVVYENGISNFRFNYGATRGTFNTSWGYYYSYGGWLVESYSGYTAVKTTGGQFVTIGWNGNGNNASAQPTVAYNSMAEDNATEPKLPQVSYRVNLPWPYDFSADVIDTPANEQPYPINQAFTPHVTITNQGTSVPTSLQVNLTMSFLNGPQVYNQTVTVNNAASAFQSQVVSFPPFTPHDTTINGHTWLGYNIYEDTAIVYNLQPTADQDNSNNTTVNEWICAPPNDIKAVSILAPAVGTNASDRTPVAVATPIDIRFRNLGTASQTSVPLTAVVRDPSGNVEYRDTVIIPNWPNGPTGGNSDGSADFSTGGQGPGKGAYYDTVFGNWTPTVVGIHKICGIAILSNDQLRADDTVCGQVLVRPIYDAAAVAIYNPQPDEEKPEKTTWQPGALFSSQGVSDLFDVPAEVRIYSCSNPTTPVFVSDSTIPELNIDQGNVRFYFPANAGTYHISSLPPGCYTICAIAKYPGDGDHTNDTACSEFSIIPQLKGNIYVGVGQRFQTIHAAVDSMRFRGIGDTLHLILTDANYTENGQTSVSSPNAAIDMRGIRGLSATVPVIWEPKPGVHPTITFSGSEPACFYFGDLFGGYMTFEGYNPLGVPVPDKLTAEPTKRGITIVDNETSPGPVFDIEQGASHLTLKDLVLHGAGNFANDSSAVVRINNVQNMTVYLQAVHDTVPINHVVVNNCELGNAKYGLYDHGLHDMFNLGAEKFIVWRNNSNVITRNTIGTAADPLSYAGIQFNNEQDLTISHNEITNVNSMNAGPTGVSWNVFGIKSPSPSEYIQGANPVDPILAGDTGNVVRVWVDANRIHDLHSVNGNAYGVAVQQAVTIYTIGSGQNLDQSTLPILTQNRITNNMIFDLEATNGSYPIVMTTAGAQYSADGDSIFNNSISTNNALANIKVQYAKHVFLWDNILQNTSAGPYANYWLEVPHPFANAISSDYNLFDLRGTNVFDSLVEYDARYGTVFQTRYFRTLNDWRSYVGQDLHSLVGDPRFASDSLHMPSALTYIQSPASNNGAWLGTTTQARDFDGDQRLSSSAVDIGADEFDGFQYTNDLAVMSITQPAGFSQTSDTSLVTTENPLWITAWVKNLSSQSVFSRTVNAQVQQATNGGPWVTIYNSNTAPMNWDANETQKVVWQGPTINPNTVATSVFRITVSVPNDQNNANNSQTKTFRILLKQNATLVSYNGATAAGMRNLDSVMLALNRLGVPFDTLDRNAPDGLPNTTDIDYTPWWTLVWVSGDATVAPSYGAATGQGGLSYKETQEVERYLQQGRTYAKKSMAIAGQNIAFYNGYIMPNNAPGYIPVTDTEWLHQYMHTTFVANSPVTGPYAGRIVGQQPAYWKFPDSLYSISPDVIKPSFATPLVGPEVTGFAYTYKTHPNTASDSGAGTTYYNPTINTVFYGFDWSDPVQTAPGGFGDTTSGTTRTLAAAFAFFRSHNGTILPVEFVSATAQHVDQNALIQWQIAQQKAVAQYDVEQMVPGTGAASANASGTEVPAVWQKLGSVSAVNNQTQYAYTDANIDLTKSYTYRVVAIDESGMKTYSNAIELGPDATQLGFTLGQTYPNPMTTGTAQVTFTLPESAQVTLRVMDVTGKIVATPITNVSYGTGEQTATLDLTGLANGSYVYELVATGADGQTVTLSKKLTLNK